MNFCEDEIEAPLFVRQYDPVHQVVITSLGPVSQAMVLFENNIQLGVLPAQPEQLTESHIEALVALKPEVILLGTGAVQYFPPPDILAALYAQRIGLEVMTTDAACRTFNVLVSEGRAVLAALFC